jgi:hypothetical protein
VLGTPVPRCPLCGAHHVTCGPRGTGLPVDLATIREDHTMPENNTAGDPVDLDEYEVTTNGVTTTMQLSKADAERLGAKKRSASTVSTRDGTVANRARTAAAPAPTRKADTAG